MQTTAVHQPEHADPGASKIPPILQNAVVFSPFCFYGSAFPPCAFEFPGQDSRLEATFYDHRGNAVQEARALGRYAAVVSIHRQEGRVSQRFLTLCRLGGSEPAGELSSVQRFAAAGIDKQLIERRKAELVLPEPDRFVPTRSLDAHEAVWAAGLYDLASGAELLPGETLAQWDRQWWVEMKRRIYGLKRHSLKGPALVSPRRDAANPGLIPRPGSPAEAGLKPGGHDAIDAASQSWEQRAGIGFATVVVHRGIIAFCKAYGKIPSGPLQGTPYTPQTIAPLASLTKLLGAILMLQFVDQGLCGFDEPIDKYLPALRGLPCENPPTIRDLYTHTAGLMGHWGDSFNDMDQIIADIYPTMRSNSPHQYHGVGHALGGKIMELISGESFPRLFRRHLAQPLELTSMQPERTSYGSNAAAPDLAKIGQMLLNGGVFGERRFCSPATIAAMLPIPGRDRIGPDPACRWGVGIKIMDNDGLSDAAFAASGACGSFLTIDPQRDLVIAHTRFEDGVTYEEFLKNKHDYIQVIKDSLA